MQGATRLAGLVRCQQDGAGHLRAHQACNKTTKMVSGI